MGLSLKDGAAPIILNLQVNSNLLKFKYEQRRSDKFTYKPYNQGEQKARCLKSCYGKKDGEILCNKQLVQEGNCCRKVH